jgi:hypothetical protein
MYLVHVGKLYLLWLELLRIDSPCVEFFFDSTHIREEGNPRPEANSSLQLASNKIKKEIIA